MSARGKIVGKVELQIGGWARSAMPVVLFNPLNAVLSIQSTGFSELLHSYFKLKHYLVLL